MMQVSPRCVRLVAPRGYPPDADRAALPSCRLNRRVRRRENRRSVQAQELGNLGQFAVSGRGDREFLHSYRGQAAAAFGDIGMALVT